MTAKLMASAVFLYSVALWALFARNPGDMLFLVVSGDKRVIFGRIAVSLLVLGVVMKRLYKNPTSRFLLFVAGYLAIVLGARGLYFGTTYYGHYSYFFTPLDYFGVLVAGLSLMVVAMEQQGVATYPPLFPRIIQRVLVAPIRNFARGSTRVLAPSWAKFARLTFGNGRSVLFSQVERSRHPP